jgi:hypothetical protein
VNVAGVTVAGSRARLKAACTVVPRATPVALLVGLVDVTVGATGMPSAETWRSTK